MAQDAMQEMNNRLDRYVGHLKEDKPERPEARPWGVTLATLLVAAAGVLWLVQWGWILAAPAAAGQSGVYVDGYTQGNGVMWMVIALTAEALIMSTLAFVIAGGLYRRSSMARFATFAGGGLMIVELGFRIAGARTGWERVCFGAIVGLTLLTWLVLMIPSVRHYYDWRVGRGRRG